MDQFQNIVLIGAGNVATNLGLAFQQVGIQVVQVYSRTQKSADQLAHLLNANSIVDLKDLDKNADLYIIAVTDDAIKEIVENIKLGDGPVVHTSGSIQLEVLFPASKIAGVLYPLQTFSKGRSIDFRSVPICLEANTNEFMQSLKNLAGKISDNLQQVDSEHRKVLHLAAVFACNFPNFMYAIAAEIANDAEFDFDILRPLIKETAAKVMNHLPIEVQTGPARRNDQAILDKHLQLLQYHPEYQKIYQILNGYIKQKYQG